MSKREGGKMPKQQPANGHVGQSQKQPLNPMAPPSPLANRPPQRRHIAKQLYRRYVNRSNLFAQSANGGGCAVGGRWQIGGGLNATPFRMSDSMPTASQLEWQKQRRAQTRQLAMSAQGSVNGPKIVQKHAEMRSYLLHCQRVLNARPRIDTGRSNGHSLASSSSITSPSVGSWRNGGDMVVTAIVKKGRARSVPANGRRRELTDFERELQAENRRLLERLVQIRMSSRASSQIQSRQSTGQKEEKAMPVEEEEEKDEEDTRRSSSMRRRRNNRRK